MRVAMGCLLLAATANSALSADPLDDLFAQWASAQRRVESLVVDFRLEKTSSVFDQEKEEGLGTFRLLRTKDGKLFASYEAAEVQPVAKKVERNGGLLNGGAVYLLVYGEKKAIRFRPDDLNLFLETCFNPMVVLLDRARAEEQCQLKILKQDDLYTYLSVKPKQVRHGWFSGGFEEGRLMLLRQDSDAVPKGMPQKIWYRIGTSEFLFDIKAWRLNPADGPKLEEFTRPEDRPGWKVEDFPLQRMK